MSRPIKFRAWVKDLKEYRKVAAIHYVIVNGLKISHVELFGKTFIDKNITRSFRNVIIEEATGLKDKNGMEIYEGDLVEYTFDLLGKTVECICVWSDGGWCLARPLREGETVNFTERISKVDEPYLEIIGNIHDKEELSND